jgi:hypothetical protein
MSDLLLNLGMGYVLHIYRFIKMGFQRASPNISIPASLSFLEIDSPGSPPFANLSWV